MKKFINLNVVKGESLDQVTAADCGSNSYGISPLYGVQPPEPPEPPGPQPLYGVLPPLPPQPPTPMPLYGIQPLYGISGPLESM